MPMNLDAVGSTSEPITRSWTSTDCLLYALGVGAGALDPTGRELEFTTENSAGIDQQVLPTFASIVGAGNRAASRSGDTTRKAPADGGMYSGGKLAELSFGTIDPAMLVHGEQSVQLFGPI